MEKKTILAFLLSAIIFAAGTVVVQRLNEKHAPKSPALPSEEVVSKEEFNPVEKSANNTLLQQDKSASILEDFGVNEQDYPLKTIEEKTDLYHIVFSTRGGIVTRLDLRQQRDKGEPIPMVLDSDDGEGSFNIAFGGPSAPYRKEIFEHKRSSRGSREITHKFSRKYLKEGQLFTLTKTYRIIPSEYMIELKVILQTPDGLAVPFTDGDKAAYTLTYGPQIGPIEGHNEVRQNISWGPSPKNDRFKRQVHKHKSQFVQTGQLVKWAGITGKYFAVIVDPGLGNTTVSWDKRSTDTLEEPTLLQVSRPARQASLIEDTYHYYIGPLDRNILTLYDQAEDNAFGISGMGLQNAQKTDRLLEWLKNILRFLLEFFYRLIPNYGVAIILLTVVVKILLFPITHKSYESTSKMQLVQPKVKELQAQHKGDPQRMNKELAALYKREGVNPMGGCLPMLLQFPIMIALFRLLNIYFPLREAIFIPGWITNLAAPEYIGQEFTTPINLLIINIPAFRLLPILYLGGQLLMTKVMQQGQVSGQTGTQQKMLTVGMPIFFFFFLYNMPSGLLLYWTVMNIITIFQQLITNYIKKRRNVKI